MLRPWLRRALMGVAGLLAALGATTWWALESGGVAIVETRALDGSIRATHVWYAAPDGEIWLEAGTPESAWFEDVQRSAAVTFTANGRSDAYRARPIADASGRVRIRALLREKYGFRDVWVGLLFDTSRSVAVRLAPAESARTE